MATDAAKPENTNAIMAPSKTEAAPSRKLPLIILAVLGLVAIAGLIYYFTVYRYFESTDNAYVKADVTWVMPRIAGEITQLNVKDNAQVQAGQMLLTIDDRDIQARYQQANAMIATKQAALGVQAQNELASQSAITQAKANVTAADADVTRLKQELNRYQALLKDGVTTRQRVESIQSQYTHALAAQASNRAAVQTAQAQTQSIQASRAQLLAEIQSAQASAQIIAVDSNSAHVLAPVSGVVGNLAVRLGSRVSPQTRMFAIVPTNSAYVEANFKETQIGQMQVGQGVELEFDAYSGKTFHGHIDSFSPASGATFSLMPPDNATGNFNKVVQRIPVRIIVDDMPDKQLLRPGLSVVAKVDLRSAGIH